MVFDAAAGGSGPPNKVWDVVLSVIVLISGLTGYRLLDECEDRAHFQIVMNILIAIKCIRRSLLTFTQTGTKDAYRPVHLWGVFWSFRTQKKECVLTGFGKFRTYLIMAAYMAIYIYVSPYHSLCFSLSFSVSLYITSLYFFSLSFFFFSFVNITSLYFSLCLSSSSFSLFRSFSLFLLFRPFQLLQLISVQMPETDLPPIPDPPSLIDVSGVVDTMPNDAFSLRVAMFMSGHPKLTRVFRRSLNI
jgi:hypothetical protein